MQPASSPPELSVVILTRNEEANVEDAVRSVLACGVERVEVIVVDSASKDRTLEIANRLAEEDPERVHVHASSRDIPIGEARNLGVSLAQARHVAFLSADAMAAPAWGVEMLRSLQSADIVYGRQEHAPPDLSVSSVVRGLRYHHFDSATDAPPETFASNVSAGIRREVFDKLAYVDDGPASALDDILFTREAKQLGFRIAFNERMLARHKDAATLKGELTKNRREGYGAGLLSPRIGLDPVVLAWGGALFVTLGLVVAEPAWWSITFALGVVYAPTLRRVLLAGRRYLARAPGALVGATLMGPFFDLAFLSAYLRGLMRRRADLTGLRRPQGA